MKKIFRVVSFMSIEYTHSYDIQCIEKVIVEDSFRCKSRLARPLNDVGIRESRLAQQLNRYAKDGIVLYTV